LAAKVLEGVWQQKGRANLGWRRRPVFSIAEKIAVAVGG
jgi:hypothetical protein